MISRIPLRCLACRGLVVARVQVGHEKLQPVSSVCPHCFTPFRLHLLLDAPPRVGVDFVESCEAATDGGVVVNIASGFVIPRAHMHEEQYFPSLDLPQPTEAQLQAIQAGRPEGAVGPVLVDLTVLLGGLPYARDKWRVLRNAYRFRRTDQHERMLGQLIQLFGQAVPQAELRMEGALVSFFARALEPNGRTSIQEVVAEFARVKRLNEHEFTRLRTEFERNRWDRMDEYVDVIDHFFRAYEEFNQVFMYARRGIEMPDDPYAPSTDFDNTKMFYGEAFEVLGTNMDLLVAVNNIGAGREFNQLSQISLDGYRNSDKGRRSAAVLSNPQFAELVKEYDNRLRNASHHRWLRLSHDRSKITYREGGNGDVKSLSYAEYLLRCCRIASQIMVLASVEAMVLHE